MYSSSTLKCRKKNTHSFIYYIKQIGPLTLNLLLEKEKKKKQHQRDDHLKLTMQFVKVSLRYKKVQINSLYWPPKKFVGREKDEEMSVAHTHTDTRQFIGFVTSFQLIWNSRRKEGQFNLCSLHIRVYTIHACCGLFFLNIIPFIIVIQKENATKFDLFNIYGNKINI